MRGALLVCMLIAGCTTPADGGPWTIGDRWAYGDPSVGVWTNLTVVARERIGDWDTYVVDMERVQPAGTARERVWFDQATLGFVAGGRGERPDVVFSCPLARVFPLEDQQYSCKVTSGGDFRVDVVSRVGPVGVLETPAGVFDATPVAFPTFRFSNDPQAHEQLDNHYAPAARNWLLAQGSYCEGSREWADCGPNPVPLLAHT